MKPMEALVCQLCNGTLRAEGSYYVCEYCGTKYLGEKTPITPPLAAASRPTQYIPSATLPPKPGCKQFAVDLGTASTTIYAKDVGIVLREPSVIAVDRQPDPQRVIAVGRQTNPAHGSAVLVHPLQRGAISDFNLAADMLKFFLQQAGMRSSMVTRNEIMIGLPKGATEVDRRAVFATAKATGAKNVLWIEQPMAAAIGAGLAVAEVTGCMVVDIGAGISETAVISLGEIVASRSIFTAGSSFDDAIIAYIKNRYSLLIDENAAEGIKINIGSAFPYQGEAAMSIQGRGAMNGLPGSADVTAAEIRQALAIPLSQILEAVSATLRETPPEHVASISRDGIALTGGGALLRGLDVWLAQELQMPVRVAKDAPDCVANGAGSAVDNMHLYHSR